MLTPFSNEPVRAELTKCLDDLRGLRDEVHLQVHLAGLDANRVVGQVDTELDAIALEIQRAAEPPRVAVLAGLRRLEETLTDIARSIPGGT